MKFITFPVTPFQQNCSLLWCEETREAVAVDPGGDVDRILTAVKRENIDLVRILMTHPHADHVGGVPRLREELGIPAEGPQREDQFWLDALPQQCEMFGFEPVPAFLPDRWLEQGDTVHFGKETMEVLHCPGHTPGHVVFFHRGEGLALVGDVLFRGSVGRSDFPGGNHEHLVHSIREVLFPLGDAVRFIPGHGPNSTFGEERRSNPFVSDRAVSR
jgi:glyoxylase-like metal-dependent hydrolase (beta-lactamase superfamily II)